LRLMPTGEIAAAMHDGCISILNFGFDRNDIQLNTLKK